MKNKKGDMGAIGFIIIIILIIALFTLKVPFSSQRSDVDTLFCQDGKVMQKTGMFGLNGMLTGLGTSTEAMWCSLDLRDEDLTAEVKYRCVDGKVVAVCQAQLYKVILAGKLGDVFSNLNFDISMKVSEKEPSQDLEKEYSETISKEDNNDSEIIKNVAVQKNNNYIFIFSLLFAIFILHTKRLKNFFGHKRLFKHVRRIMIYSCTFTLAYLFFNFILGFTTILNKYVIFIVGGLCLEFSSGIIKIFLYNKSKIDFDKDFLLWIFIHSILLFLVINFVNWINLTNQYLTNFSIGFFIALISEIIVILIYRYYKPRRHHRKQKRH